MSKRRKPARRPEAPNRSATRQMSKTRRWREIRLFSLWFVLLAGVIGSGLAAFKYSYDTSHDLSVIGKGVPAVVQIHDPDCPLCNQLRRNANAAAKRFGERLLYRIADISTSRGRQLQRRHDVPNVTLLLFDGDGELRKVLNGVKSDDVLYRAFDRHLQWWGPDSVEITPAIDS
ncbi:MAG: hypothetical protein GY875_13415 [Gammaproteobacteria bacterium]|nr:hypothetical protein [Gammaproteobacteria bacterium]